MPGASKESAPYPIVHLEDLWDFSFCPLKLWWRRQTESGAGRADGLPSTLSGEELFRESLRQAVKVFYRSRQIQNPITFPASLDLVWNGWMQEWDLASLRPQLVDFLARYRRIMAAFSASGGLRRADGTLYTRPTWSKHWQDMARANGLYDTRHKIEEAHPSMGLPSLSDYADEDPGRPIGLAEAYAISADAAERNEQNNAFPPTALGVQAPLSMDLLSVRLQMTADLILSGGPVRGRGRPRKDPSEETETFIYELHLYDDTIAPPHALAQDLRVLALLEARPSNWPADRPAPVRSVMVRHMRSGQMQPVNPRKSSSLQILEFLSRGLRAAEQNGVLVPRLLHGWMACSDCSLRPRCFSGEGVLSRLLPGSQEQLESTREHMQELLKIFPSGTAERQLTIDRLQPFLQWMLEKGVAPEQALWALQQEDSRGGK